jgi:hypothetical protein
VGALNKVYRQIQNQDHILGLEVLDFLGVLGVSVVVLNLANGIVCPIIFWGIAHVSVWFLKRGKPPGWTRQLVFELRRPKCWDAGNRSEELARYPSEGRKEKGHGRTAA